MSEQNNDSENLGEMYEEVEVEIKIQNGQPMAETESWEQCLENMPKELIEDAKVVWNGLQNESFWLPANASPQNLLEQFAKSVFDYHTQHWVEFKKETSGCEWWVQIKNKGEEIDFHWDKDECLLMQEKAFAHPQLATVTYLQGECGAPTIITDAQIGMEGEIPEKLVLESVEMSFPRRGKHLVFDGRVLHGVSHYENELKFEPPKKKRKLNPKESSKENETRITLLVNIWLDYIPFGIERLMGEILTKMHRPLPNLRFEPTRAIKMVDIPVSDGDKMTFPLWEHANLMLTFPTAKLNALDSHLLRLQYQNPGGLVLGQMLVSDGDPITDESSPESDKENFGD